MNAITLNGAVYTPYRDPVFPRKCTADEMFKELSAVIGQHEAALGAPAAASGIPHLISSTIVEMPFTTGTVHWNDWREQLSHTCRNVPAAFTNAYECAGWGYLLRYLAKTRPSQRHCLITVFDVNLFNMSYWLENPNWEQSGFGILTLLFERPDGDLPLQTGFGKTHNPVAEFAIAVRNELKREPASAVALPFFPEGVRALFERTLKNEPRLPDLHPEWGHCFGSDPWLSLIHHRKSGKIQDEPVLCCSLALNGYYSLARVVTAKDAPLHILEAKGGRA
ncbi:hypothetical protein QQM79_18700 [Marinobacteraceae bacterium S3BR75-40.1]